MSPRIAGATKDLERGKRLKKVLKKMFPKTKSRNQKAEKLGVPESSLRNWEAGMNIDNRALAKLGELGGDIYYILTGKKNLENVSNLTPAQQLIIDDSIEEIRDALAGIENLEKRIAAARRLMMNTVDDPAFAEKAVDAMAQKAQERLENDMTGQVS
jgi:transcriptional regulator with XRE-family HTH domain